MVVGRSEWKMNAQPVNEIRLLKLVWWSLRDQPQLMKTHALNLTSSVKEKALNNRNNIRAFTA